MPQAHPQGPKALTELWGRAVALGEALGRREASRRESPKQEKVGAGRFLCFFGCSSGEGRGSGEGEEILLDLKNCSQSFV